MYGQEEGEKERAEMAVAAVTERARHGQYKLVWFEQDYERGEREIVNWRLDERTDLASLWCQSSRWRISLLSLQAPPGMKWSVRIRRTFEKLPERIGLRSCLLADGSSEQSGGGEIGIQHPKRASGACFLGSHDDGAFCSAQCGTFDQRDKLLRRTNDV